LRGHIGESRVWLSVALAGAGVPPALRARTLVTAGFRAWSQGENVQARLLLEQGLALYRDLGDRRFLPGALQSLALVVERQGDYPHAVTLLEESLSLCEDTSGTAIALGILGQAAERQGDLAHAATWLEQSLSLLRQVGDLAHVAEVLGILGSISRRQGDNERAAVLLEESLALHRELEDRWNTARELHALWLVRHAQGEQRRAAALLRESAALFQALEDRGGLVELLEDLAGVLGEQQRAHLGARLLGAANAGRAAIGAPLPPGKRARYEQTKAELAATLGEEAFTAAWAAGQATGLDEAGVLALEGHTS
jgi:tetratricopeptide (TPR) repeat protein